MTKKRKHKPVNQNNCIASEPTTESEQENIVTIPQTTPVNYEYILNNTLNNNMDDEEYDYEVDDNNDENEIAIPPGFEMLSKEISINCSTYCPSSNNINYGVGAIVETFDDSGMDEIQSLIDNFNLELHPDKYESKSLPNDEFLNNNINNNNDDNICFDKMHRFRHASDDFMKSSHYFDDQRGGEEEEDILFRFNEQKNANNSQLLPSRNSIYDLEHEDDWNFDNAIIGEHYTNVYHQEINDCPMFDQTQIRAPPTSFKMQYNNNSITDSGFSSTHGSLLSSKLHSMNASSATSKLSLQGKLSFMNHHHYLLDSSTSPGAGATSTNTIVGSTFSPIYNDSCLFGNKFNAEERFTPDYNNIFQNDYSSNSNCDTSHLDLNLPHSQLQQMSPAYFDYNHGHKFDRTISLDSGTNYPQNEQNLQRFTDYAAPPLPPPPPLLSSSHPINQLSRPVPNHNATTGAPHSGSSTGNCGVQYQRTGGGMGWSSSFNSLKQPSLFIRNKNGKSQRKRLQEMENNDQPLRNDLNMFSFSNGSANNNNSSSNYNNMLLNNNQRLSTSTYEGNYLNPSQRACSFHMRGFCRKEDCEFQHDLKAVLCRFYTRGECFKGEYCQFSHDKNLHDSMMMMNPSSDSSLLLFPTVSTTTTTTTTSLSNSENNNFTSTFSGLYYDDVNAAYLNSFSPISFLSNDTLL